MNEHDVQHGRHIQLLLRVVCGAVFFSFAAVLMRQ